MAVTRQTLIVAAAALAAVLLVSCADDNDRYDELAAAAEVLGGAIGGTEVTVIAAPSPCVDPESCPDSARVDLPDRVDLSLEEIAAIAADLGWNVTVVDDRLIMLESDADMSGSISIDTQRRVALVVGED